MANLAEQGHQPDGTPRGWLARVRELGELLHDSDSVTPPPFIDQLSDFSAEEERVTRLAYLSAVRDDRAARADRFALAAATCPVVAEPCVWMAYLARGRGDSTAARSWAAQARRRLSGLGAAWDRRLSPEQWLALIDALEQTVGEALTSTGAPPTHPHALLEAVVAGGRPGAPGAIAPSQVPREPSHDAPRPAQEGIMPLAAADGRRRFGRYVEALADGDPTASGAIYPDLPSRPWHRPQDFALVHYLEANFTAIREEILGLESTRFHRESERISRIGDWDVAFFYERGRRHDDLCVACPVTTRGIETHPTVRTMAGLIYVSRMRPSTHISAHRGPTNLRLRCHLGIEVPEGDCAIRVGQQTRRWAQGRCLVFDDHFEHEAWNHTAHDRIVLIVDLWHPSLSAEEVRLLEALHRYAHFHARRLGRYWSVNAAARARQAD
jgi:aspartate beta-hydroxylase